jgi:thymidylate synthase (FAD)
MKYELVSPAIYIKTMFDSKEVYKQLEEIARVCYKSESLITKESYKTFISNVMARNHYGVLEHFSLSVKIIADRAVAQELTRHRLASFLMESQRYVNYNKKGLEFVVPYFLRDKKDTTMFRDWENVLSLITTMYENILKETNKPEQARCILPNCTKTELIITANLREWRHILELRTKNDVYPDLRELMNNLKVKLIEELPLIFGDLK